MSISASIKVRDEKTTDFIVYDKSQSSEEDLIAGCKKGKRLAQNKLYDQYCGAMLNIAMRYCGNQAEAEDALQDAFLKIFKNIVSFEGRHKGSLTQWIKTIVINSALSLNRKNKKHNYTEDVADLKIADAVDFEFSIDEETNAKEKQNRILNAIQDMPAGYRSVFNLYVMEGYAHKEIAGILEVSENTSKSQLSKARKFLKSKLGVR